MKLTLKQAKAMQESLQRQQKRQDTPKARRDYQRWLEHAKSGECMRCAMTLKAKIDGVVPQAGQGLTLVPFGGGAVQDLLRRLGAAPEAEDDVPAGPKFH